MSPLFRRGGTLVAAASLTLTTLAASPLSGTASAAPAAAEYDAAPGAAGAAWLTGQLEDGLIVGQYGPDYGLSADTALGLAGLGGHGDTVRSISTAIAAHVHDYISGDAFGDPDSTYVGAVAKSTVLAQTAEQDARSFGGVNLVARLEARVSTAPTTLGRVEDRSAFGDYANVIGQAFAAQGLDRAGSTRAADATAFLLKQQCDRGYFRLSFTKRKAAADQSCDGGNPETTSAPDTDVTALAVLALEDQRLNPAVADALDRAEGWLKRRQERSGAFGGGTSTAGANTNSTGLAGWALHTLGATGRAARAAAWVRLHQTVEVGACAPYRDADLGAIAYDRAGLRQARAEGITEASEDQFRRASAQALPVLRWAPAASGEPGTSTGARAFWRAGRPAAFQVTGAAPGEVLCVTRGTRSKQRGVDHDGAVTVRLPRGTGVRTFEVVGSTGSFPDVAFHALGRLRVPFRLDGAVSRGDRQVVKVRGLAPGERVRVALRHRVVDAGRADDRGRLTSRFRVRGPRGDAEVTVTGQFPGLRRHTKTFTVTR